MLEQIDQAAVLGGMEAGSSGVGGSEVTILARGLAQAEHDQGTVDHVASHAAGYVADPARSYNQLAERRVLQRLQQEVFGGARPAAIGQLPRAVLVLGGVGATQEAYGTSSQGMVLEKAWRDLVQANQHPVVWRGYQQVQQAQQVQEVAQIFSTRGSYDTYSGRLEPQANTSGSKVRQAILGKARLNRVPLVAELPMQASAVGEAIAALGGLEQSGGARHQLEVWMVVATQQEQRMQHLLGYQEILRSYVHRQWHGNLEESNRRSDPPRYRPYQEPSAAISSAQLPTNQVLAVLAEHADQLGPVVLVDPWGQRLPSVDHSSNTEHAWSARSDAVYGQMESALQRLETWVHSLNPKGLPRSIGSDLAAIRQDIDALREEIALQEQARMSLSQTSSIDASKKLILVVGADLEAGRWTENQVTSALVAQGEQPRVLVANELLGLSETDGRAALRDAALQHDSCVVVNASVEQSPGLLADLVRTFAHAGFAVELTLGIASETERSVKDYGVVAKAINQVDSMGKQIFQLRNALEDHALEDSQELEGAARDGIPTEAVAIPKEIAAGLDLVQEVVASFKGLVGADHGCDGNDLDENNLALKAHQAASANTLAPMRAELQTICHGLLHDSAASVPAAGSIMLPSYRLFQQAIQVIDRQPEVIKVLEKISQNLADPTAQRATTATRLEQVLSEVLEEGREGTMSDMSSGVEGVPVEGAPRGVDGVLHGVDGTHHGVRRVTAYALKDDRQISFDPPQSFDPTHSFDKAHGLGTTQHQRSVAGILEGLQKAPPSTLGLVDSYLGAQLIVSSCQLPWVAPELRRGAEALEANVSQQVGYSAEARKALAECSQLSATDQSPDWLMDASQQTADRLLQARQPTTLTLYGPDGPALASKAGLSSRVISVHTQQDLAKISGPLTLVTAGLAGFEVGRRMIGLVPIDALEALGAQLPPMGKKLAIQHQPAREPMGPQL